MDMVTMNIIDSTMVSICREMGITMMKTSYSTIFNEGLDFTCGLGNTRGELIGVAEFNPSQIGGLPLVLQTSVQEIPHDEIEEGDVIVHNDPYRGGMHTPEHTFIKPVFHRGELMALPSPSAMSPRWAAWCRAASPARPPRSSTRACACPRSRSRSAARTWSRCGS